MPSPLLLVGLWPSVSWRTRGSTLASCSSVANEWHQDFGQVVSAAPSGEIRRRDARKWTASPGVVLLHSLIRRFTEELRVLRQMRIMLMDYASVGVAGQRGDDGV